MIDFNRILMYKKRECKHLNRFVLGTTYLVKFLDFGENFPCLILF